MSSQKSKQKLYLIPNTLDQERVSVAFDPETVLALKSLRIFFVEEIKSARKLLKFLDKEFPIQDCRFYELNEHSTQQDVRTAFAEAGPNDLGMISEAGCPCVADPGAELVSLAHQSHWDIIPLVGPSSILLALMASGLNGQNFCFSGYLPKDRSLRIKRLRELERCSGASQQAQIFMEAPYRNQHVFEDLLHCCQPETWLCLAVDLLMPTQWIYTCSIAEWKKQPVHINKKPTIFILQSSKNQNVDPRQQ